MNVSGKTTDSRVMQYLLLLLFMTGCFVFIQLNYRYFYHFMGQYTLFRTTTSYFSGLLSQPGGLNAYLSEFMMQLYHFSWGAAMVISILSGSLAVCFYRFLSRIEVKNAMLGAVLPLFLFWIYPVESLAPLMSLLFALLSANLYIRIKREKKRAVVGLLLVTACYFLAAPAHLELVLLIAVFEILKGSKRSLLIAVATIAWGIVLPWIGMRFFYVVPFREAWLSKHLYHPEYPVPASFWGIWLAFPLWAFVLYGINRKKLKIKPAVGLTASFILLTGLMVFLTVYRKDPMEQAYRYDYYTRHNQWERIVDNARKTGISDKDALIYTHLALSHTGQFNELFLQFPQIGVDGLIPHDPKSRLGLIEASEVAWQLNHINSAQRFAFVGVLSSQRCVQPRLMQRLVQTYLVNGEYKAAAKYITLLEMAPLYRSWARGMRPLLDPTTAENTRWIREKRAWLTRTDNFFDLTVHFSNAVAYLLDDHIDNTPALEYAMGYLLIRKDLGTFIPYMERLRDANIPLPPIYQEAICLIYSAFEKNPEAFRSYNIQPETYNRFVEFAKDFQRLSPAAMKERYGNTYYYYAQFVPTPEDKKK